MYNVYTNQTKEVKMDLNFANHMVETLPSLTEMKSERAQKHKEMLKEFAGFDIAYNHGMESLIKEVWNNISDSLGSGEGSYSIGSIYRRHLEKKMVSYIMSNIEFSSFIDMAVVSLDNLESYKQRRLLEKLENTPESEKQTAISNFLKKETEENYRDRLRWVVQKYLDCRDVPNLNTYWYQGGTRLSQCSETRLRYLNLNTDFHSWFCDQISGIVSKKGMDLIQPTPWRRKPGTKYVVIREHGQIKL